MIIVSSKSNRRQLDVSHIFFFFFFYRGKNLGQRAIQRYAYDRGRRMRLLNH